MTPDVDARPDDGDPFGSRLAGSLGTALRTLPRPVPTDALVAGALVRGRRIRLRRRLALVGGACLTAGALAGAALLTGWLSPGGAGRSAEAESVRLPRFEAAGQATPGAGEEPLSGRATAAILAGLLGEKGSVSDAAWWDTDPAYPKAVQTQARMPVPGAAPGTVRVRMLGGFAYGLPARAERPAATSAPTSGAPADGAAAREKAGGRAPKGVTEQQHAGSEDQLRRLYSCAALTADAHVTDCGTRQLAGGAVLAVYTTRDPAPLRTADLLRTDGTRIVVTAPEGTLTDTTLRAAATSSRWHQWVPPKVNTQGWG